MNEQSRQLRLLLINSESFLILPRTHFQYLHPYLGSSIGYSARRLLDNDSCRCSLIPEV